MPSLIAAGAVVWRRCASGDVEVVVVHRPRYDDWSLPKGKPRSGELLPVTAVREVAEETGHTVTLGARLGATHYRVTEGKKVAHYWAAHSTGGSFHPSDEVDELRWLSLAKAIGVLTYSHDQSLLAGFDGAPAVAHAVLLVRHAKAGKSESWQGDDDLRPLSTAGHRQAETLRTLLPLFGAQRVHAAPPLRCRQTVEGLAADLGVPVIAEPQLSEDGYAADPAAGLDRLIEIATGPGGPAAVCSQGGVIPDVVRILTGKTALGLPDDLRTAKGSYWVLSFSSEPVLLAADYYDDALH